MKVKNIATILEECLFVEVVFTSDEPEYSRMSAEQFREALSEGTVNLKRYSYKAPVEANLNIGDFLMVDSPNSGYVITRIVGVSEEAPQGVIDDTFNGLKWAIEHIDAVVQEEHAKNVKASSEHVSTIKKHYYATLCKNIRKSFELDPVKFLQGSAEIPNDSQ